MSAFYLDWMMIPLMRLRAGFTVFALLTTCVDQGGVLSCLLWSSQRSRHL